MEIKLPSGRRIANGEQPFIIAEVGSNWATLEDCMTSISQAKACGADAVKFQAYDRHAMYGLGDQDYARLYIGCDDWDRPILPMKGQLPIEWLPKLAEKCRAVGIEFMCSAFSPELIDAVDPYVSIHKLASAEMCHVRMLERLRGYGKPVIMSTGAQHLGDIGKAMKILGETPTVLLYCVAAYPARVIDLDMMETLRAFSDRLVGYSDHSTDVLVIPGAAIERGACVIEKHVNFVGATGPDSPHSLNTDEFKFMVDELRDESAPPPVDPGEQGMITRHKRRLIATRDIAKGDKLIEGGNFGIYRSLEDDAHAFSPFMIDRVNGWASKRAIKAGDGIGPGDI